MATFVTSVRSAALSVVLVSGMVLSAQPSYGQGGGQQGREVIVANTATAPVPVRDVDRPARQPFARTFSFRMESGKYSATMRDSYVVPAGKRLVIEFVSIGMQTLEATVPPRQLVMAYIPAGPDPAGFGITASHFLVVPLIQSVTGSTVHAIAQQVHGTVEAGFLATPGIDRMVTTDGGDGIVTLSGYLVDVP